MSLVGFQGQNHPQQVARRGAKPEVDNLETPWDFFAPLHDRFGFTIDVAALPHNAKCERFYTPDDDGLARSWRDERVWCNPPYSDLLSWVGKARRERQAELIVMLVPANRTEQKWWQTYVEPFRDGGRGAFRGSDDLRVEFLPGRLRFIKHGHDRVEPNQRPPFGCCLLIWGDEPKELPDAA